MSDGFEPLPDDLRDALKDLLPPPEAPEVREALLSKLHATVGAAGVTAGATVGTATAASAGLTVPWWVAGVALVAGLGGGAAIDRLISTPPAPVEVASVPASPKVVVEVPSPNVEAPPAVDVPTPVALEPVRLVTKPVKAPVVVEPKDAGAASEPSNVSPDESLRSERLLIDAARAALARDPQAARAPLDEHATRFPKGQLSEEREALMIQALVLANDAPAARKRFEAFSRSFPSSPLLGVLRSAVEGVE